MFPAHAGWTAAGAVFVERLGTAWVVDGAPLMQGGTLELGAARSWRDPYPVSSGHSNVAGLLASLLATHLRPALRLNKRAC